MYYSKFPAEQQVGRLISDVEALQVAEEQEQQAMRKRLFYHLLGDDEPEVEDPIVTSALQDSKKVDIGISTLRAMHDHQEHPGMALSDEALFEIEDTDAMQTLNGIHRAVAVVLQYREEKG